MRLLVESRFGRLALARARIWATRAGSASLAARRAACWSNASAHDPIGPALVLSNSHDFANLRIVGATRSGEERRRTKNEEERRNVPLVGGGVEALRLLVEQEA